MKAMAIRTLLLGALLALSACEPDNRPTMNPGQDCISCHTQGGLADSLRWTAAGTVYASVDGGTDIGVKDVHVLIQDALGKKVKLTTNEVGNFYTAEPLAVETGLQVTIEYQGHCRPMGANPTPASTYAVNGVPAAHPPTGVGCNHCHQASPLQAAPGKLAIPQWFEKTEGQIPCPAGEF